MFAKSKNLVRKLFNLHNDEDGMEAIQVVAIVAIAAIVLIFLKGLWHNQVEKYANKQVKELVK